MTTEEERKEYCCPDFHKLYAELRVAGKFLTSLKPKDLEEYSLPSECFTDSVDLIPWTNDYETVKRIKKCPYCGYDTNELKSIVFARGVIKYDWTDNFNSRYNSK